MSDRAQAIVSGAAWASFCDSLKDAGNAVFRAETPGDVFNRGEGLRYLTRLIRLALEKEVEHSDPRFPQFFSLAHETAKIGNDNPDNIYLNATVSGEYDYVISGHPGTVDYLSIGTKAGGYGSTGRMEATGQIYLSDLDLKEDGSFEIVVSRRQQSGNWLPMQKDTTNLLVRQTFKDRSKEKPAVLNIRCLNGGGENLLDPLRLADQLERAVRFVGGTANLFVDWMERYRAHLNQLPADDQELCIACGGDPAIYYLQSFWKLAPDEALVIRTPKIPKCRTWNFQLSNYWMESLDYRYFRICLNKFNAVYEKDGSVKIVVAHRDPGAKYPNWLTTAGHDQGGMLFRWVEADEHLPVHTSVVRFSEL